MITQLIRFFTIPYKERKQDDELRQEIRSLSRAINKRRGVYRTQLWGDDADGFTVLERYFKLPLFSLYPTGASFMTVGAVCSREEDITRNKQLVAGFRKQCDDIKVLVRGLSCERYQTRGLLLQAKRAEADGIEINFSFNRCSSEDIFNNLVELQDEHFISPSFIAVNLSKFKYDKDLFSTLEGLKSCSIHAIILRKTSKRKNRKRLKEILSSCSHEIVYV